MGWLDYLLLGGIAAAMVAAFIAIRRGKTGGCGGDCEKCHKNCDKPGNGKT